MDTTTILSNIFNLISDAPPPGGGPPPPGGGRPPPGGGQGPPPGFGNGTTANISILQRNIAQYGYLLLFLFGFFGNINTMVIFLRHSLRSISTSCLFVCIGITDTIYLFVCIYDFLYNGLGLTYISQQNNSDLSHILCRFRSFIQSVAMCSSSWLLLAVAIDRWLRIRFPFEVRRLCTIKRSLFGVMIIIICAIALNSHLLTLSFGNLSFTNICGPIDQTIYMLFFRQVWGILLTCLQTILPTSFLLIISIDMFCRLRIQQKQKQRLNPTSRRAFIDRQMLIIMSTSIFLFFCTQIPLSFFNILLSPVLRHVLTLSQALDLTTLFVFIASINFGTTFYIHCLTSGLFREEFFTSFHCKKPRIGPWTRTNVTQTQTKFTRRDCKIETTT